MCCKEFRASIIIDIIGIYFLIFICVNTTLDLRYLTDDQENLRKTVESSKRNTENKKLEEIFPVFSGPMNEMKTITDMIVPFLQNLMYIFLLRIA